MKLVDTSIVDLHRAGKKPMTVRAIAGEVWRVADTHTVGDPLVAGDAVSVGETIFVSPGARIEIDEFALGGGARGLAHSFVPEDAFKTSPSIDEVPRLVQQLEQLERQVIQQSGEDPLADQQGPKTAFERAMAAEFAFHNLDLAAARSLPSAVAHAEPAVCLFHHGDAVCVAVTQMSVRRIRTLMAVLGRPVNPHLVDDDTIRLLLAMVYRPSE